MPTFDFISIGDITTDAFIHLKEPSVHCDIDHNNLELCMGFGDKIPYDFVEVIRGTGNAANAAVCASRLGLKTAAVTNLGDDENGKECVQNLKNEQISTQFVTEHAGKESNCHYVLWFENDRTILVKHHDYERKFPNIGEPKWVYFTSIGPGSDQYHEEAIKYFEDHPSIKVAFQPGTYQVSLGTEKLARLYKRTGLLAVNNKEAKKILKTESDNYSEMLDMLAALGPKMVLVTDGEKGAYFFDAAKKLHMPVVPGAKAPYERTGAGDSYTATLITMMILGKSPEEALRYSSVNSNSVVCQVGAQKGLMTLKEIEKEISALPETYHAENII